MAVYKVEKEIAGRMLSIETGKYAKQAHGSTVVQYGDTVVLSAAVCGPTEPKEDAFFPLMVDYRERTSAAGKYPGGFIKREGRPTNKEILTMRMIDRPIRPLFPKGYFDEVQIQNIVLSADKENDPDILAIIASSAALAVSPVPFQGPIAAVRIGRIDGEFILNPTATQMTASDMDLLLAGHKAEVNMIELGCKPMNEADVLESIKFGHKAIVEICLMIEDLQAQVDPEKQAVPELPQSYYTMLEGLRSEFNDQMREARQIEMKQERADAVNAVKDAGLEKYVPADADDIAELRISYMMAFEDFQEEVVRDLILEGKRAGGRKFDELRKLTGEVGILPRTHGSAVFTRGETQAMVIATLGTASDEQRVDGLGEEYSKKFMLDYNFPPFSVGECRPIRGPGRREIGHGALAERSLAWALPSPEDFPYTVRLVSDILESNGSSSMATICGGTLAMLDAGVPLRAPVAGISTGLVTKGDKRVLITDILGEEDHFGDMDFKVAGTRDGITGIQLDLKIDGLSFEVIEETFSRAKATRFEILDFLSSVIDKPREELSIYAPKLIAIKIDPEKIGKVIGPGGKMIRKIQEDSGATIEIDDDGTVNISCSDGDSAQKAKEAIEAITEEVKVGKVYTAEVMSTKDFGAFVEVLPGQDGLVHISEMSDQYVGNVNDVVNVGDVVKVKVINIDDQGRIKLSMKGGLNPEIDAKQAEAGEGSKQNNRGDRKDRGNDRRRKD